MVLNLHVTTNNSGTYAIEILIHQRILSPKNFGRIEISNTMQNSAFLW